MCFHPDFCLAWGIPGLGSNDPSKMSASSKNLWMIYLWWIFISWIKYIFYEYIFMMNIPIISASSFYVPRVSHNRSLPTTQGTPPKNSRYVWPRLLWSFCPGFWCMWDLLCTLQDWSLCFPQSSGASAVKPHWPSKPHALGVPPPNAGPPGWGAWHQTQNSHFCGRTSMM